jgi:ABC-2 type transport system ATP-binding protein
MIGAPVVETDGLGKSYGKIHAVRNLNLTVAPGRITAFLGLNGAGKSTTIRMLLGMIKPTEGAGRVLGKRIDDPIASLDLRRHVAYVTEDKRLYGYMTVDQLIRFTSSFYSDWRPEVVRSLLQQYQFPPHRKIRSLSKGMRTKLALLLALARRPELLILDEPSEGLDPVGIEDLLQSLVTQCAEGTAVFFSSHQIAEVERVADQVCILHQGRLVMDASLDDLRLSYRQIDMVFPSLPAGLQSQLELEGVESIRSSGHQMSIFASRNADAIMERARALHAGSIEVAPVGLREIFLQKVKEN